MIEEFVHKALGTPDTHVKVDVQGGLVRLELSQPSVHVGVDKFDISPQLLQRISESAERLSES